MVGLGGLEPPTSRLSSARSNQLSYKPEAYRPEPCLPAYSPQDEPSAILRKEALAQRIRKERETKTAASRKCPDGENHRTVF